MTARLPARMVAKPWGRGVLPPPFAAPPGETIGEVWFEPPAACADILIKYIFTSEPLSVQVHPPDSPHGDGAIARGKEECWLVIAAEPGARLGIGFDQPLTPAAIRTAARDGSIEQLLAWHPVAPGDFFYIPAGTVHAIGAGVSLVEIQQNSDVTYRLYDYGRPRELHLDQAVAVARTGPHPAALRRRLPSRGAAQLANGPHFRLDRIDGAIPAGVAAAYHGAVLVVPLDRPAAVAGEAIAPGECAIAAAVGDVRADGLCLLAQPAGQALGQAGTVDSIQPPPTTRSPA